MRWLLAPICVLAIAVAAACGGGQASSPSASPTTQPSPATPSPTPSPPPTPTPAPTPSPSPPPTPVPATIDLSSSQPRQGGFLVVRLLNAPGGIRDPEASFTGQSYTMLPSGGHWYALIGLPTWFQTGGYPIEVDAAGGAIAAGTLTVTEGGFQFESIEIPPGPADLLLDQDRINQEHARVAQVLSGFTPERYWSGPWIMPAQGTLSDPFGLQRSINGGPYSPHTGTDIANAEGTPIYAAATGVVALAEQLFLYGNSVIIDHGAGVFSAYNHMQSIVVTGGQSVAQGQLIGYMGQTGLVTGPHVHWEAVVHGVRVDPVLWTQAAIEP